MGRRQFLDTRIVMKNSVYVVGMKIPGSGSTEEAVSILRSNDYFGQYGKIARIFLRDRAAMASATTDGPDADSPATETGIYIVYVRREDAARAISSLDGIPAPQGPPGQVLHASYGTTRYCDFFLRGLKCDNPVCQNLHEWGGEGDTFTRNDLETALTRPAEYDARQKQSQLQPPPLTQKSAWPKPSADDVESSALPRTANWGVRPSPARPGSSQSGRGQSGAIGSQRPTKIQSTLIPLGGRSTSAFPPPAPSPVLAKAEKKKAQNMARGRSDGSSASAAVSSGQASPKKKPITVTFTSTVNLPSKTPATSTNPPPGITPPPGLGEPPSPKEASPAPTTPPVVAPPHESPVQSTAPVPEPQPEAGPSTYATSPVKSKQTLPTEYPIHSPYPDFDDVFMEPDAVKMGFSFSLAIDDDELQRLLALSHEVGGFEPNPFDPLFEELPKLGIPIASLMAAPRELGGTAYAGPFSPFAPSSPIETHSLPTSEEPSGAESSTSDAEPAPRTASRFDFARRASLASTGRGQSPFHGREEWGRTPSSNGYGDEMRAPMIKPAPHGYHPALVHLNSHVAAAAAASAAGSDSWPSNGDADSYSSGFRGFPQQQQQPPPRNFGGATYSLNSYGSPQIDYAGPQNSGGAGPHVPPGYESYVQTGPAGSPQVFGQMGYVQQRRY